MGFDVPFVDPLPDHLKCPICLTAFEQAMQTICGHLFCQACLERLPVPECSVCKEPLQETGIFPDRHVQREVMVLRVKCPNVDCGWTGTLKEWIDMHDKACEFEQIKCQHRECGARFLRKYQQKHNEEECKHRMVPCRRCRQLVPSVLMKQHNESECIAGRVSCPMKCGRTLLQRSTLDEHLKKCPLSAVECPYSKVGCKKRLLRHEVKHHLAIAIGHHTDLVAKTASRDAVMQNIRSPEVQELLHKTVASPSTMAAAAAHLRSQAGEVQRADIERLENVMSGLRAQLRSLAKPAADRTTGANSSLATSGFNSTDNAAAATADQGQDDTDPRQQAYALKLLDDASRHQERSLMELNANIADLELRVNMCEVAAYNGVLTWKVTRWSQRRAEAKNGRAASIYSQPFYTDFHGYKCCTRLYPNGDGDGHGTHASLFFVVMQNDYDAIQDWPFGHKVTFSLLNQIPGKPDASETFRPDVTSSSFHRPSSAMNVASGCPKFADLRRIEDPDEGFVTAEDCIFIKVVVDTTSIRKRPAVTSSTHGL